MIIVVLLLLGLMPSATADDPLGRDCGSDTSGKYTAKSTYQDNLKHLHTILPKNTSSAPTLFAKGSVGAAPDTVYGLALCRGDANASACGDCVSSAFQDAQQQCAFCNYATIFYDSCLLSFSNKDFLNDNSSGDFVLSSWNTQNITEPMLPGWDPGSAGSVAIITDYINGLVENTAKLAAYNSTRMYATARMDVSSTFPTLYSMAQCTPDLQPGDCWDCLQKLNDYTTRSFNGSRDGEVIALRCNFRYDTNLFYQDQPMLQIGSPVAVPIQKHKSKQDYRRFLSFPKTQE